MIPLHRMIPMGEKTVMQRTYLPETGHYSSSLAFLARNIYLCTCHFGLKYDNQGEMQLPVLEIGRRLHATSTEIPQPKKKAGHCVSEMESISV